ncbi:MAG: 4'-phosphopantetheinyl transferase family protein [Rhodoblastus sp.]
MGRALVARRAKCAPEKVFLSHDAKGAPHVLAPTPEMKLSLAAREDVVAAAVADRPLGVDIETMPGYFDPPLNVLHPDERDALVRAGAGGQDMPGQDMFMRIWTAKEAYVKALGLGFNREPRDIAIKFSAGAAVDEMAGFAVFDLGRRVDSHFARVGPRQIGGRSVMLACIVLAGGAAA